MTSLKATILNEIDNAIEDAGSSKRSAEETVHLIRRRSKRIRAYLRLLPSKLSNRSRSSRQLVRLAATSLSSLRDAQVMNQTCGQIQSRLREIGSEACSIDTPANFLVEAAADTASHSASPEHALELACKSLRDARCKIERIPSQHCDESILVKLQSTYKDGRHRLRRLFASATPEDFHELRKTTKQFYFQSQFAAVLLKLDLNADIARSDFLADKLGSALDLSVLASKLSNMRPKPGDPTITAVINESKSRMHALFDEAVPLACRLFFETPKQFLQRITHFEG